VVAIAPAAAAYLIAPVAAVTPAVAAVTAAAEGKFISQL
jgi:hypothetical protein